MILSLIILPSSGEGLPLFSHTRYLFSPHKATQLAEAFRVLMRTIGKGANPHKGTVVLLKYYLTSYLLLNEFYILTVQPNNGNPFTDRSLLKRTRAYLLSFCKGEVTTAKLMKSYSEVFMALEKLVFEELHSIDSRIQNTENDWAWRRQEVTLEARRFEEILKPNTNSISERLLSLRPPLPETFYGELKEWVPSQKEEFDPFNIQSLPPSAEYTSGEGFYHPPSPRINFFGAVSGSASSPDICSGAETPTSSREKELEHQPAVTASASMASSTPSAPLKQKREKRKSILGTKSSISSTDDDAPTTPGRNILNIGRRSTTGLGRIARESLSKDKDK
eukprot:TRINITY_DN5421_c0_g1_i1.p1 TRINITY_DN5421_c0_g1~~TRINITY_DN5421_c0_g1_i1.p1  ORF type:complete len:335 (+),score=49.13 TRINITY_DN5421_c0_g1_i1:261-1265(+)